MQLVLDTNGLLVKKRNESFYIIRQKQRRIISPYRVDSILVTADCMISSAAIRLAVKFDIPIIFANRTGKPEARMWHSHLGKEAQLRRAQYRFLQSEHASSQVINWYQLKGERQLMHLRELQGAGYPTSEELIRKIEVGIKKMDALAQLPIKEMRGTLLGTEGNLAKNYWQALATILKPDWKFGNRSRRPAQDEFNALLNYSYGMLYTIVEGAIFNAGLDPQLGVFHVDDWGKSTLSFDLIEPFRPWVDEFLMDYCLQNAFRPSLFVNKENGIWLAKEGRALVIPLFNAYFKEKIKVGDLQVSRKNHIYHYVGKFAKQLRT